MLNQARLRILKAQEDHVKNVLDEARSRLFHLSNDKNRYGAILQGLISQGLFQLLESKVVLRCRQKDLGAVEEALPHSLKLLNQTWGQETKVTIDRENFLNPDIAGGVEVYAREGKIKVVSTLESRLDLISQQMIPEIRNYLFGRNPNRKFLD
jgi:V-type H+-transporting ATPase subunit E